MSAVITCKIFVFTRAITKFSVSLKYAVFMLRTFLLPGLELALHYVSGPQASVWVRQCNRLLIACLQHAAASKCSLSHTAVSLSLGFLLPSWLEVAIKVSELFLRVNSSDARWGRLGRALMREAGFAEVTALTPVPRDSGSRLARTVHLAQTELRWSLHLAEESSSERSQRASRLLSTSPLLVSNIFYFFLNYA